MRKLLLFGERLVVCRRTLTVTIIVTCCPTLLHEQVFITAIFWMFFGFAHINHYYFNIFIFGAIVAKRMQFFGIFLFIVYYCLVLFY